MDRARWVKAVPSRSDLPRTVTPADITRFQSLWRAVPGAEALECSDPACSVNIVGVEPAKRDPFFRKAPRAAGKDREHSATCLFNIERRLAEVRRASAGYLVDDSTTSQARYRLLVPDFLTPAAGERTARQPGWPAGIRERAATAAILRSAASVGVLLEQYQQAGADPDTEFLATCRGRTVSWSDFFYPPDRIAELRRRVIDGDIDHPAVVLTDGYYDSYTPSGRDARPVWHRFTAQYTTSVDETVFLRPEPASREAVDDVLGAEFDKSVWWIAFGFWSLWEDKRYTPKLQLDNATAHQISKASDAVTAAASKLWPPAER